ncbi:hypothetical protein AC622_03150 [Bacillus sp. FJAT-27916]|uniref:hypothetical protein n=1 Tax=Bacillus sp. FJAT-27916 TaxID=1679169 RepID=UPI0006711CCA|nr:hypothetical protein [Bacillus sp. FJAT-27916]KMY43375.1 hypothetical protein AC622_03150 [Bacillus sp. FJAT-27916]
MLANFIKWILIPILILLIGYEGTVYFENNSNRFINIFTISKEINSLTTTIWSVQAGIISLSIALLALVVGPSREKRYGLNLLEFYFVRKRKLYTGYEVIIILLLMIPFNYFFVAKNMLFGTLLNFFICLLGVLDILISIFKFLKIDDEVRYEIRSFILDEFRLLVEKENKDV